MTFPRASGILLHPTSLPGPYGIGELGTDAFAFLDFLEAAGQHVWQVLPLGPAGYGDSPYQAFSAFAGNPLLVSLERLREQGLLDARDLASAPPFPTDTVEYERVAAFKLPLLRLAFERFQHDAGPAARHAFDAFRTREAAWLEGFAAFMALKQAHGGEGDWTAWAAAPPLRPSQMDACAEEVRFRQYLFFTQWDAVRRYAAARGIRIMGDLPIYVAHDSADVWAHPELFQVDAQGQPLAVAGVPPDYFSATGQLWGNPLYRWDVFAETGYAWWVERFQSVLKLFDMVRVDHFRGFEAYWEVPAGETTAVSGRWVKGPGAEFFRAVEQQLGPLPLVAENLGVITPEVEAIREQFGYPGMSVLQFAFGTDPQASGFKPHNYPRNLVAYSGTHDNDTTVGWWQSTGAADSTRTSDAAAEEKAYAREYLNIGAGEIHWVFIRTLMASVADTVLFPMQDVLGLGSQARMNKPATAGGNWRWRCRRGAWNSELTGRLRRLAELYDRT